MANVIDYSTVEEVVEVVKAERDSADYGKNRIAVVCEYKVPVVSKGVKLNLDTCTVIIGDTHHRLIQQFGTNASTTTPLTLVRALQVVVPSLQKVGSVYNGTYVAPNARPIYADKNGFDRANFVDFNTVEVIKKH